jgi:hypothetical protein
MRQRTAPRMGPVSRWVRGWWPDRNRLRRSTDRVEAAVAAGLLAVLLTGGPAVAVFGSQAAYHASLRLQATERASLRLVRAVLLASAPRPSYSFAGALVLPQVRARWTAPGGASGSGLVPVFGPAKAGSTVKVWVDASGRLAGPPVPHRHLTGQAVLGAMVGISALALVLACAWAVARRMLHRRRLAAWEDDWGITSPRWNSLR